MEVEREDHEGAPGRESGWGRGKPACLPQSLAPSDGRHTLPFPAWAFCQNIPGEAREHKVPRAQLACWTSEGKLGRTGTRKMNSFLCIIIPMTVGGRREELARIGRGV